MKLPDLLYKNLKKYFGYNDFRPKQKEVLAALSTQKDIVAILPTGSGKSLCYQLPATYLSGLVIVVSPLIALMKDQVDSLAAKQIKAAYLNSSLEYREHQIILDKLRKGNYDILYVAPERFQSESFLQLISQIKVDLLAIDEAHCISEWGHDFRPSYLKLAEVRKLLGAPQLIALTATATPEVRSDIINILELKDFKLLIKGFIRNNLKLAVQQVDNQQQKNCLLVEILIQSQLPAVIYVGTRNRVEEVVSFLSDKFSVIGYHGGMSRQQRKHAQNLFMSKRVDIVIATNAFGMGVDKSDIRLVIHYEMPATLEAYYQEIGRGGRDGYLSKCILLYHPEDSELREFLIESDYPSQRSVELVYRYLLLNAQDELEINLNELYLQLPFLSSRLSLEAILRILGQAGYLKRIRLRGDLITYKVLKRVDPNSLNINYDKLRCLKQNKHHKLAEVKAYISTAQCRHQHLLAYFGRDKDLNYCPGCDNCSVETQKLALSREMGILIQKILSTVIKLGGNFGATTVAKLLIGSKSKKLLKRGLDKISTYNIVNNYSYDEIIEVINELISSGYLIQSKGRYPIVKISSAGYKILHHPYELSWSLEEVQVKENNLTDQARNKLLLRLKRLRSKLAQQEQVASFTVVHDQTLVELVKKLPESKEELLKVNGIAQKICQKYGDIFLKEIQSFLKETPYLKADKSINNLARTYQETLLLYQEDLGIAEIAAKRNLTSGTIVDHLVKLITEGAEIDINKFIDVDQKRAITSVINKVGYDKLRNIKEELSDDVSYEQISLVVADYKMKN